MPRLGSVLNEDRLFSSLLRKHPYYLVIGGEGQEKNLQTEVSSFFRNVMQVTFGHAIMPCLTEGWRFPQMAEDMGRMLTPSFLSRETGRSESTFLVYCSNTWPRTGARNRKRRSRNSEIDVSPGAIHRYVVFPLWLPLPDVDPPEIPSNWGTVAPGIDAGVSGAIIHAESPLILS
jgi:hypothetical protein